MTTQRIENSDRGITLNKQLAWTIGGGLIGSGLYVGLTIATLSTQVAQSRDAWQEATLARQQLETRVRVVEINQAGQTSDLRAIQVGISEIKAAIKGDDLPGGVDAAAKSEPQSRCGPGYDQNRALRI